MAASIHFFQSFWNCSLGSITNISQVTSEGSHLSGGILLPLDPGEYLGLDLGRGQVQAQVLAGTQLVEWVRTRPIERVRTRPIERVRTQPIEWVRTRQIERVRTRPIERVRTRLVERVRTFTHGYIMSLFSNGDFGIDFNTLNLNILLYQH